MKRILPVILLLIAIISYSNSGAQVYINVRGDDSNDGSKEHPKASLQSALRKVREMRRLKDSATLAPIRIILQEGVFQLSEPVFIRPEDAGTLESPTYIEGAAEGKVILSGGITITGWQPFGSEVAGLPDRAKGHIWSAPLSDALLGMPAIRQLWVNGVKAVRAKWPNGGEMERILNWNKKNGTCDIPALPMPIGNVHGMEMFVHQWWEIAILRIRAMEKKEGQVTLHFRQPESRIQSEHPWPAPWISEETGNSAFYLSNCIEFLDEPGEWYVDDDSRRIYYWPRPGEDMNTASVFTSVLENLVNIKGTIDDPVQHIHLKNIAFQHTGWNRPSLAGHVPHQAGMPMTDAYKLKPAGTKDKGSLENQAWITRPEAAVKVSFAHNTSFENCSFQHLASTGLDYNEGVKSNLINGNLFKDIGGTAILLGVFADEAFEIHLPYNPKDQRVVADSNTITNNFVTNATNEDWGAVGIGLGYTRNSLVAHNEIENVNYSGISLGWGWSPKPNVMKNNKVKANKVHHFGKQNYDCAGIYTLSSQPGSLISENYIDSIYKAPYAHLPTHWFYLYTDEGSSYITIKDNWTPSHKYLQNNNGPGNKWINNGPDVASVIKQRAGLKPAYRNLREERTSPQVKQAINTEYEEIVELVVNKGKLDMKRLNEFLKRNNIDTNSVYRWMSRYVIFAKIADMSVFAGKLRKEFPQVSVRPYYDLYYRFDRSHCKDTATAREWTHVILTANLSGDVQKQREYLSYHATQFDEWPEIASGFCDAGFQRLMMFRNGKQIMLIISIPKGKTLDELNPKTTENNPKMNEWNKLMGQYQEGIEGTEKGEVWVLFEKIKKFDRR